MPMMIKVRNLWHGETYQLKDAYNYGLCKPTAKLCTKAKLPDIINGISLSTAIKQAGGDILKNTDVFKLLKHDGANPHYFTDPVA